MVGFFGTRSTRGVLSGGGGIHGVLGVVAALALVADLVSTALIAWSLWD